MSLVDAIASLQQGSPYTVTRRTSGVYEQGRLRFGHGITLDSDTDTFTVDDSSPLLLGQAYQLQANPTGSMPAGLNGSTPYYVQETEYSGVYEFLLAPDEVDSSVPFTSDGSGVRIYIVVAPISIVASVQPVTGRELQSLPEGQRGDEIRVIYTTTELKTRTPTTEPDTILLDGAQWPIIKVERFDAFGNTHYRAYAARTERP